MPGSLEKILYVEDDEDIAFLTVITLEDIGGFQVQHCNSGAKAIEAMQSYAPQLLLLDVMMPGMDGCETLEYIRLMPEGKNVPAVFMTAKSQVHEQEAYIKRGAVGVISKPYDPEIICDTLRTLWEHAEVPADS